MRLVLFGMVAALTLTGCATEVPPAVTSSDSSVVEQAPSREAMSAATGQTGPEPTDPRPRLDLACPNSGTAPADVTFGWTGDWIGEPTVVMDYGDGKSYTAVGAAEVEAGAFEHTYQRGGAFPVTATLTDATGGSVVTSCDLSLTAPVVHAAPEAPGVEDHAAALQDMVGSGGSGGGCYFEGHRLYGDVKVVEYGADIRVQRVDYAPDIRVKQVDYGAYGCGEWHFVDFGGDFSVEFVDYAPDLRVQFVDYSPGMN